MSDPDTFTFDMIVLDLKTASFTKVTGKNPPIVLTFMTLKRAVVATVLVAAMTAGK